MPRARGGEEFDPSTQHIDCRPFHLVVHFEISLRCGRFAIPCPSGYRESSGPCPCADPGVGQGRARR